MLRSKIFNLSLQIKHVTWAHDHAHNSVQCWKILNTSERLPAMLLSLLSSSERIVKCSMQMLAAWCSAVIQRHWNCCDGCDCECGWESELSPFISISSCDSGMLFIALNSLSSVRSAPHLAHHSSTARSNEPQKHTVLKNPQEVNSKLTANS